MANLERISNILFNIGTVLTGGTLAMKFFFYTGMIELFIFNTIFSQIFISVYIKKKKNS